MSTQDKTTLLRPEIYDIYKACQSRYRVSLALFFVFSLCITAHSAYYSILWKETLEDFTSETSDCEIFYDQGLAILVGMGLSSIFAFGLFIVAWCKHTPTLIAISVGNVLIALWRGYVLGNFQNMMNDETLRDSCLPEFPEVANEIGIQSIAALVIGIATGIFGYLLDIFAQKYKRAIKVLRQLRQYSL